jgi:hypothetical protein
VTALTRDRASFFELSSIDIDDELLQKITQLVDQIIDLIDFDIIAAFDSLFGLDVTPFIDKKPDQAFGNVPSLIVEPVPLPLFV